MSTTNPRKHPAPGQHLSFRTPSRDFNVALRKMLNGRPALRTSWQRLTLDWPIASGLVSGCWEYLTDGPCDASRPLWGHCVVCAIEAHTAAARHPDRERLRAFLGGLFGTFRTLPAFQLETDRWVWDPQAGTPLNTQIKQPPANNKILIRQSNGRLTDRGLKAYIARQSNDWVQSLVQEAHGKPE